MTTIPVRSIMCIFSNISSSFLERNMATNDPPDNETVLGTPQSSHNFGALDLVAKSNCDVCKLHV